MKVALVSLDQKWEDKASNLLRCKELVAHATASGADLVIFPEMTLTGFTMNTQQSAEDIWHSPSLCAFSSIAKDHGISLIVGLALGCDGKTENTLVAFSADGSEHARYAKIHPFSLAGEARFFRSGNRLARMRIAEFMFGFSICYDLRFPELYSALAKDCEVIVNIANWPKQRIRHWWTLLQARAIENQVFVIGVNRTGMDGNGLEYERSSAVVNANGEFIEPVIIEGEVDIFEISRNDLMDYRQGFSTRQDRRPKLYRDMI